MGNSVSAESVCRRFIHFRRGGANRGPVAPLQNCKKIRPPPLFEFEGQLPTSACVVRTDLAGGSFIFRCGFSGASPPLRYTERRTLTRTRTRNQNRIIISARVHGPVTPIPQQSLGYDTRDTGEQTARSPTSLATSHCRGCLPKVHPFECFMDILSETLTM